MLALAACGSGGGASGSDGEFELKFSTYRPADHPVVKQAIEPFIEAVEEGTEGRVSIELFTDAVLGTNAEQVGLVQNGTADFTEVSPAEAAEDLIWGDVATTYVEESTDPDDITAEGAQVSWNLVHTSPYIDRLDEIGVVPFGAYAMPQYELFSSSEIEDLPGDLQGAPVRTPGGLGEEMMAAIGINPISIASSELYEAMSRGTVDSYMFPWYAVEAYSLDEVTKYATDGIGIIPNPGLYGLMSKDTWESLPKDIRQVIYDAGKQYSLDGGVAMASDSERVIEEFAGKSIELREVTEAEREEMAAKTEGVLDKFVERMAGDGRGEDAQKAVDAVKEMQDADIDPSLPVEEWPDYDIGQK